MKPFPVLRVCALRPRRVSLPFRSRNSPFGAIKPVTRHFADDKSGNLKQDALVQTGPNVYPEDHVSEEAAKIAKIQGKEGPDLDQGTPVQEILKDDKEAQKQAPKVLKEDMKAGKPPPAPSTSPSGRRSFHTYARRRAEMDVATSAGVALPSFMIPSSEQRATYDISADVSTTTELTPTSTPGHKFPLPELPLPPLTHRDYRYDPICTQFVGLLMRDGKKSVAQRNLSVILNTLRTAPVPTYNASRPMPPGTPPASHLPLNPITYLTVAIDCIGPLLRVRSQRGAAGGGAALQIPIPLNLRQRRRTAIMWVLNAASKRQSSGSGPNQLALRIASELISVVEGRSGIWEKRNSIHRAGMVARMNVNWGTKRRR